MATPMEKKYVIEETRKRRAAASVVLLVLSDSSSDEEDEESNKRMWMKPWLRGHDSQGAYPNLVKKLETCDLASYRNFLRMSPDQFRDLVERVRPYIAREDTNFRKAIPTEERLAVTLRFLATGETYKSLSYSFRLGSTTIGKIIPETCHPVYNVLKDEYLKITQSPGEWLEIARQFDEKWNFSNTLGALDGMHVALTAPHHSDSVILLMGLVDANYKFIYIDVGCNSRISDGGVFSGCTLAEALNKKLANLPEPTELPGCPEPMSYHIVGDEAFPVRDELMKPYPFRNLTKEQRIFIYRLSRARRVVENAFGILCARFRVFLNRISLEPNKAETLVMCACALHNFLISKNDGNYVTPGLIDPDCPITHNVTQGTWWKDQHHQAYYTATSVDIAPMKSFDLAQKEQWTLRYRSPIVWIHVIEILYYWGFSFL